MRSRHVDVIFETVRKIALIVLSGLTVGLAFPTLVFGKTLPDLGILAWVGLVPLLTLIRKASPRQALLYGTAAALIFHLITAYWLYTALHVYGGVPVIGACATLFLYALVFALFTGAALCLARWSEGKWGGKFLIWVPVWWTVLEWVRNYIPFGGFPWANLAMSQGGNLLFLQLADVTGVYGIIFVLVWINAWLAQIAAAWSEKTSRKTARYRPAPETVVTLLLLATCFTYGFFRLRQIEGRMGQAPRLAVGLIQPNIPQEEKMLSSRFEAQQTTFARRVHQLEKSADLIVWPETSLTHLLWEEESFIHPRDIGISGGRNGGSLPFSLIGSSLASNENGNLVYYNSALLVDAHGNILDKYRKRHLIPFGEYVPLRSIFDFLEPLAVLGDYARGTAYEPVQGANDWAAGVLICGEDLFPEISRNFVRKGAQFLANMTNDAWYGRSSQPLQHAILSRLRAVETRRTVVRATNTGLTAAIEPTGRVALQAPLFEESILLYQIPLMGGKSLYVLLGDWWIAACFLFVFLQMVKRHPKPGF